MRKFILFSFLLLLPAFAQSSLPYEATLEQLARSADHILVGRIVGVDMIDSRGKPITRGSARTGPGQHNTIRLIVAVDEVLVSNAPNLPRKLKIPLDTQMHYSLSHVREEQTVPSEPMLFLLGGAEFGPILPGVFARPMSDREEALRLHASYHP